MAVAYNPSYSEAFVVTPSNTLNFDGLASGTGEDVRPCHALYVGTGGVVAGVLQNGAVVNMTAADGELLPMRFIRVNLTNTTADNLVAFYSV